MTQNHTVKRLKLQLQNKTLTNLSHQISLASRVRVLLYTTGVTQGFCIVGHLINGVTEVQRQLGQALCTTKE